MITHLSLWIIVSLNILYRFVGRTFYHKNQQSTNWHRFCQSWVGFVRASHHCSKLCLWSEKRMYGGWWRMRQSSSQIVQRHSMDCDGRRVFADTFIHDYVGRWQVKDWFLFICWNVGLCWTSWWPRNQIFGWLLYFILFIFLNESWLIVVIYQL